MHYFDYTSEESAYLFTSRTVLSKLIRYVITSNANVKLPFRVAQPTTWTPSQYRSTY
jgi:hypothetical protein